MFGCWVSYLAFERRQLATLFQLSKKAEIAIIYICQIAVIYLVFRIRCWLRKLAYTQASRKASSNAIRCLSLCSKIKKSRVNFKKGVFS
jgi:hypothetical protein